MSLKLLQEKPDINEKIASGAGEGKPFIWKTSWEGSEFLARRYKVDLKAALNPYPTPQACILAKQRYSD